MAFPAQAPVSDGVSDIDVMPQDGLSCEPSGTKEHIGASSGGVVMSEALKTLMVLVKRQPISQGEFRKRTGYSKSYVNELFGMAEVLGVIAPCEETWQDRTRHLNGPKARRRKYGKLLTGSAARVYSWAGGG